MNWFDVGLALQLFMAERADLTGYVIQLGSLVPIPEAKTVVLIRGPYNPKTTEASSKNELTLFVECWEEDETDSADPAVAYGLLSSMEKKVFDAINDFGRGDQLVNGQRVKVRILKTDPDGDQFRPKVASRTTITIIWQ